MKTVLIKKEVYTFDELDQAAKEQAVNDYVEFLMDIYDPDKPKEMPFVAKASKKADAMQTPWFWGSYIYEYGKEFIHAALRDELFLKTGKCFNEEIYQELTSEKANG